MELTSTLLVTHVLVVIGHVRLVMDQESICVKVVTLTSPTNLLIVLKEDKVTLAPTEIVEFVNSLTKAMSVVRIVIVLVLNVQEEEPSTVLDVSAVTI